MGDLDRELEKAISESEAQERERGAEGPAPPAASPVPEAPAASSRKNWGLLAALLAIAGGILALVFSSAEDAAIYSLGTDQLVEATSKYEGRNVRVEGALVKGSLRHRSDPCEYRFDMEKNGKVLAVRYPECVVPDTFRDMPGMDVLVTAEGKWNAAGHFEASHIMAKCPSKYEMDQRAKRGEAAPHAARSPETPPAGSNLADQNTAL